MALTFQAVTLDTTLPDREGTLVFRDGRLLAILTRLSDIHDDLAGHWFVEAWCGDINLPQHEPHASLEAFERSLAGRA